MTTTTELRSKLLATYEHAGPGLATVFVPTRSDVEDAEKRIEIRRDNVLRNLEEAGAPDDLLGVVERDLDAIDHSSGAAHVLVASAAGVILSEAMSRPLAHAKAWYEPVPMLVPLLAATQTDALHIAALIDRSGADVMLRSGVSAPLDTFEVDGPYERLQKSSPGGWSQKRFQQTAENAWELNAREVIDAILEDYPDTELVICGGDERAVGFFVDHLPERIEVHVVDGSRHADADAFLDAADVALRDRAATAQVDLLDNFRTALGNDNAVKGDVVIDMLVQGRVSDLLVVDNSLKTAAAPTLQFDLEAGQRNTENTAEVPLAETAVARAVATGAAVHVVADTSDTTDGVAAILRF